MKRAFASVLALTIATPLIAGNDATMESTDSAYADGPIVMDDKWKAEDLATFDAPQIEREGWVVADATEMTTEELTGIRVYDANDEWIGEIDNVIVSTEGSIEGAVLGVGGFLAIGEKDVLVDFDSLTIKQEADGEDMRVYASMTEEQLEALPAYES
ncbi:PRC-barrel domain-containing protein [Tateyamaria sp. SN6-1]|uniref:PRC-barrel domain-containing protein n=1 Tax=Tateyamaria sp. SN6-1 TaxID=3092148 RepID=UPI0039F4BE21